MGKSEKTLEKFVHCVILTAMRGYKSLFLYGFEGFLIKKN
jgi:hypothetical protein